jgi:hypothetical protein
VKISLVRSAFVAVIAAGATTAYAHDVNGSSAGRSPSFGHIEIATIPFDTDLTVRSATYTPSGKVLVSYAGRDNGAKRAISNIAAH